MFVHHLLRKEMVKRNASFTIYPGIIVVVQGPFSTVNVSSTVSCTVVVPGWLVNVSVTTVVLGVPLTAAASCSLHVVVVLEVVLFMEVVVVVFFEVVVVFLEMIVSLMGVVRLPFCC